jgi:hypothetical protein
MDAEHEQTDAQGAEDEVAAGVAGAAADGPMTGGSKLRAAVASLGELDDAPLTEHIERYTQIHAGLQDALSGIEGV